jgi:hypothetical protein
MIAKALSSCPVLCSQIGLQGLACLATSSNKFRTGVEVVVCRDWAYFLNTAVGTAREDGQHKRYQTVAWLAALLLHSAPTTAANLTSQLLNLPAVPLDCAMQMVLAGLRVTCPQLLAAANSMVAGLEVWVRAQQQLGIQTDIPAAAVSVCYGIPGVSIRSCSVQGQTLV